MTATRLAARPRVLAIGFFTALWGLTMLLAIVVIQRTDTAWRFATLLVPLAFAALTVRELRRSMQSPDEPVEPLGP